MKVLVTGGAGYVGGHTVLELLEAGADVVVLDDLSSGSAGAVPVGASLCVGDCGEPGLLDELFRQHRFDAVMHFAALTNVALSVHEPARFYEVNTLRTLNLVRAAGAAGIRAFLFSSTAAVYGEPASLRVAEDAPCMPVSPYGRSKLAAEWIVEEAGAAAGMATARLRYFNVTGADPAGRIGQNAAQAPTLFRRALEAAYGLGPALHVYGTDLATPDGSAVRDYVHVCDIAAAHAAVLDGLMRGRSSGVYNVGYGRGRSVLEIIAAVERETGRRVPWTAAPPRPGEIPGIVADVSRLCRETGWTPGHDNVGAMVSTLAAWMVRASRVSA